MSQIRGWQSTIITVLNNEMRTVRIPASQDVNTHLRASLLVRCTLCIIHTKSGVSQLYSPVWLTGFKLLLAVSLEKEQLSFRGWLRFARRLVTFLNKVSLLSEAANPSISSFQFLLWEANVWQSWKPRLFLKYIMMHNSVRKKQSRRTLSS